MNFLEMEHRKKNHEISYFCCTYKKIHKKLFFPLLNTVLYPPKSKNKVLHYYYKSQNFFFRFLCKFWNFRQIWNGLRLNEVKDLKFLCDAYAEIWPKSGGGFQYLCIIPKKRWYVMFLVYKEKIYCWMKDRKITTWGH